MGAKYIFLRPSDGVAKLLSHIATNWRHFFINRLEISRECAVRYNNDVADDNSLTAVSVDIDSNLYKPPSSDLLKDFDYVFSWSYSFMDNPPGLTLKQILDDCSAYRKVHHQVESNSRRNGQKTLLSIDVLEDAIYTEKPLEFFFAQEFLSQQHVDRDMHQELNIEIAEKFDLNNYNH